MSNLLLTVGLSLIVIALVLLLLINVKTPYYRLQQPQVEKLLTMVIAGEASENDWAVFTSVALLHNPTLEAVRLRCLEIEEEHYLGHTAKGHLLSPRGLQQVSELLQNLQHQTRQK